MKTVRVKINPAALDDLPKGRVDKRRLDATREHDIAMQVAADDAAVIWNACEVGRYATQPLSPTSLPQGERG